MMQSSAFVGLGRTFSGLFLAVMLWGCAATPGREQALGYFVSSAFSPDGQVLAAATSEGEVALFNARPLWFRRLLTQESDKTPTQRGYTEIIGAAYRPRPVAFSRDGTLLAAGGVSGGVVVWDAASGMEKIRLPVDGQIVDLVFAADGLTLIGAGPDILLWSMTDGGHARKVELPPGVKATAIAVSPDGLILAAGLSTGEIAMFDATNLKLLRISKEHEASVTGLAFQREGGVFASTAGAYDLKLWKRTPDGGFEKGIPPVAAATSAAGAFDSAQGAGALL